MIILGIETTCDETAAALVKRHDDGRGEILANIIYSQFDAHAAFGGVVPEIAARAHVEQIDTCILAALNRANMDLTAIDGVAVAAGPGLIGGVIVGVMTAKAIAFAQQIPLLGVNHLEGHALTVRLSPGLDMPYLLLLASGGHTQLILVEDVGRYHRLGTTIDDALGEAFDKTAKLLGLGFPGGPAVERAAANGNPHRFNFPRPLLDRPGYDFSFSGLKTAVRRTAERLAPLASEDIADICASFQEAVCDCLASRIASALTHAHKTGLGPPTGSDPRAGHTIPLVAAGGVAANQVIRARLHQLADQHKTRLVAPPPKLCTDNGAMIAWAGAERLALGIPGDPLSLAPRARWPLDPNAAAAPGAGVKA